MGESSEPKEKCYNEDAKCEKDSVLTCNECDGKFCLECFNKTHRNGGCDFI